MNEWINAEDEKPEPYRTVLAIDNDSYCIAYIGEFWSNREDIRYEWCIPGQPTFTPKITHWQYVPEKPERMRS